jgi:putative ABC transport system permease protein
MLQDLIYAFRSLRRAPGYGLMMVLTLALGIGANTAIFTVAWQVLLKPLPFADEERIVMLWEGFGPERAINPAAPASYLDWRRDSRSFDIVAAFSQYQSALNLTGAGEPVELDVTHVTEDFFGVLGLAPLAGRPILPGDAQADAQVVVLSEHLWRRNFGGSRGVIGRTVRLHGEPFEVIGVVPDHPALGSAQSDAWVRLRLTGEQARMRQAHYLRVIAKLRPGVSVQQADDEVRRISERAFVQSGGPGVAESARVRPIREEIAGAVRPAVLVLLAAAGLVLLIGCANISGLQLARQIGRQRDLAIHAALGASRARQVRQQLAESLLLALPAGYGGLILGVWVLATLSASAPALESLELSTSPQFTVVAYTFVLSIAAALACASISSWRSGSPALQPLLSDRGASGDRVGARLRTLLVSAEVALSVLVLIGAALLVSSLVRVLRVDPGFKFGSGLVVNLDLPDYAYPDAPARTRFFDRVIERVSGLPGVDGACTMTTAPLVPRRGSMTWVAEMQQRMVGSEPTAVSPQCFDLLGIPLLRGRTFTPNEAEPVVIASAGLAKQLFGDGDPIGRRVHMGLPDGPLFTVVGVVGDIRQTSLERNYPRQMWLPGSGSMYPPRQLIVRTSVPPAPLAAAVRSAVREIDPALPVSRIETMEQVKGRTLADRRFNMLLLSIYGIAGLALCAVGVYGLLSQIVGQRTREIGVRMALGARPSQVVHHILLSTALSVCAGAAAGILAAVLVGRFVKHMLFGVSPTEPAVYAAAVGVVVVVAFAAAYIRRGVRLVSIRSKRFAAPEFS